MDLGVLDLTGNKLTGTLPSELDGILFLQVPPCLTIPNFPC